MNDANTQCCKARPSTTHKNDQHNVRLMAETYACTRCLDNYCKNCKNFLVNDDPECLLCGMPVKP